METCGPFWAPREAREHRFWSFKAMLTRSETFVVKALLCVATGPHDVGCH